MSKRQRNWRIDLRDLARDQRGAVMMIGEGETAIISEVCYDFTPFLSALIVEPQVIHRRAHHRPRLGTLEEIEAG